MKTTANQFSAKGNTGLVLINMNRTSGYRKRLIFLKRLKEILIITIRVQVS